MTAQARIVVTDWEFADLSVEQDVLGPLGVDLVGAQVREPAEVREAVRGAAAVLVQYAPIPGAVLRDEVALGLVSRYGIGVDSVDLDAASELGVWVCNVVDYGVDEVVAHTAALVLATYRHVPFLHADVRAGRWHYAAAGPVPGSAGATLGVVGLGRLGSVVASRLAPFFERVLGHDPHLPPERWPTDCDPVSLEELAARADALTIHAPLTDATHHLVGAELLAGVKPGAVLVNASRGGLVDPSALRGALDHGRLRAAGLDVLDQEPPPPDHPLIGHPRVCVTPHAAWYSEASELDVRRKAAQNVARWLEGNRPQWVVREGTRTPP